MRPSAIALFAVAAAATLLAPRVVSAAPQQSAASPAATEDRLRGLLWQRLKVVRQLEEVVRARVGAEAATRSELTRAEMVTLGAELDLADTPAQRVALHEKIVERARLIEKYVLDRYREGIAKDGERQEATLARLDAEIALERERRLLPKPPTRSQAKLSAERPM